jgi:mRNA interferase RelE/StbE
MYTVRFSKKALKDLDSVGFVMKQRVLDKVEFLAKYENPRNGPNIKTMKGYSGRYRYRVADVRVIYEILDQELVIWIIELGYRGGVYR